MKIINSILSNRCTLIGYDSRSESVVDKITDSIPNKICFTEPYSEDGINNFFTSKEIIRDLKINSIISHIRQVNVIVNLTYLKTSKSESPNYELKNMLRELNSHLYNISNDDFKINLIILSQVYKGVDSNRPSDMIRGGSQPLYMADYAIILADDKLKVIKDRNFGDEKDCKFSELDFELL